MRPLLALVLSMMPAVLLSEQVPGVEAASYIAIDADSGMTLFEKNADLVCFPASTTKIMTALLVLEKCDLDSYVVAPLEGSFAGESSMNLRPGERISIRDLLYCIMLRSANDGSQLAALHISGSEAEFGKLMTARARELGAVNTNFVNPHGLHDDRHYSTARDLAIIAREAMRSPFFRHVVATQKHRVERSVNVEDVWMVNRNKLLQETTFVDGIKTGYTKQAGRCFVGSAQKGSLRIITVVLNSPDWKADTLRLMESCFATYERRMVLPSRHDAGRALVRGGRFSTVRAVTARSVYSLARRDTGLEPPRLELSLPATRAPVRKGQELGKLSVLQNGYLVDSVPLIAMNEVPLAGPLSLAQWSGWTLLFIGLGAVAWKLMRLNGGG